MAFFPELVGLPLETLTQAFDSPPSPADAAPAEDPFLWFSEVALAIAQDGEAGVNWLLHHLPEDDEDRLRAVLFALSSVEGDLRDQRRSQLEQFLLAVLADQRPLIVAAAVDGLTALDCADALDRVLPLLAHDSPYVVGSVLRFLARHHPEKARPALLLALKSAEPIIRQNAVDELDELDYVEALPALRRLLNDEDGYVRQAAQTAVSNLGAGKVSGTDIANHEIRNIGS
ncbi:MAG TPA: HEAT repeat domain-containing protein [Gemmataceae bacterium]|nr:HEAT repeat domain-containing protein [Gemmataceae bacterium]